ncbi:IPP transferase [Stieleria varia]|uniref:tRNA dimethylallyltransferase n=1 Tax=Stieleria varia TaxID=2528005 RepID=A0A5C6AY07_9BACT|nr:IPP transferase [Stieleria varia]
MFAPLVDKSIVLTGPTASGKSSVAVELAQRIGGEILSLDSIAVYREMDIGTAKPSEQDRQRVPHHLIDLVAPDEDFSVACYLKLAHRLVDEIRGRGGAAIFVGGTPMFLKAVLRGFDTGPPPDWEFRRSVEADLEEHGAQALHARLMQADPLAAHRIDLGDTRRMIRALEVVKQTGIPLSHQQNQFDKGCAASDCRVFAFQWPREQLHARINRRVDEMFEQGLVDEVKKLVGRYGQLSRTACQAVGYREILPVVHDDLSARDLAALKEQVAAHTRQLARRQETWFRSFSEITPITVNDPLDVTTIVNQITSHDQPAGLDQLSG